MNKPRFTEQQIWYTAWACALLCPPLVTWGQGSDQAAIVQDQLQRLGTYITDAVQPNGLVRDSLTLSPNDPPFHPATPDAAGFALLGLCAADRLGLLADAEATVESILSAYSGNTAGVTPLRSADGHWVHFMNLGTGLYAGDGWDDSFSPIGSALLVAGAQFAGNHFIDNLAIADLAQQLTDTTDFNAAIHPSLDGRVYRAMAEDGGGLSDDATVVPWNEYMLVVILALRQQDNARALAVASLWLDAARAPTRSYQGIETITDNPATFAPAFWVQQQHFFNADFSTDGLFEMFFSNLHVADALYCSQELGETFRLGLTAGVIPDPPFYSADRIQWHNEVFSPEAVVAWGGADALMDWVTQQDPDSDPRYRYGLVRESALEPQWVPFDAGLVDHLFLMFGLVESIEPLFFKQRQFGQDDVDSDGIADTFDNCAGVFNPTQTDRDDDGIGDACEAVPATSAHGLGAMFLLLAAAACTILSRRRWFAEG